MSYQPSTIATVIKRLNVQYFLPAIQREFVWKPEQIIQLFDSILRGYPISSFLFWELEPTNKDKWEVYRFIEDFDVRGTHNPAASPHGVQQLTLVLDGQQRLTSLLIGLKGSYTSKKKYMRAGSPNAWVKQRLYLDLLKDPKANEDDVEIGVRYGFRFAEQQPQNTAQHCWFPVGRILDFDSRDRFDEFRYAERDKLPETTTKGQMNVFERTLNRLYEAVWSNETIAYYTEHDQDYDRVLDIFVRANEGGTKLSKSDLLLSMVTAKWGDMNARQEIYGFVDELNQSLTRRNDFDKDFVMKSCLVLSDLPVAYLVKNFSNENLDRIRQNWPDIKQAMRRGIDLVNSFGIDRDTLTSANALIPVLYYLFKRPGTTLRGSTPYDVRNASIIRRWLLLALLNNVFTGASDTALSESRRVLKDLAPEEDFPAQIISAELAKAGRLTQFNAQAINNFLALEYGDREAFLALTLLHDERDWGTITYHQDHIFPQALFSPSAMTAAGIPLEKHARYRDLMNCIGNLELLLASENEEKSNKDFETWLTTRDASFKQRHLIPSDPALLRFDRFEEFITAREALIRHRLVSLFSPVSGTVQEVG